MTYEMDENTIIGLSIGLQILFILLLNIITGIQESRAKNKEKKRIDKIVNDIH